MTEEMSESEVARLNALVELLRAAGADEPVGWARSEVSENIAQAARFSFLRAVWRDLERWRDPQFVDAYLEEIELDDLARAQIRKVLARVAFQVSFEVVMVIDNGEDLDGPEGMPGWRLMELGHDGEPTGRDVGGLHESFLEVDPLGVEAEDIRGW